jgi:hypothetical protein
LAGSLKRELKARYGIEPKMKHAYHELEVLVDGRSVFCYTKAQRIPTVAGIIEAIGLDQQQ